MGIQLKNLNLHMVYRWFNEAKLQIVSVAPAFTCEVSVSIPGKRINKTTKSGEVRGISIDIEFPSRLRRKLLKKKLSLVYTKSMILLLSETIKQNSAIRAKALNLSGS